MAGKFTDYETTPEVQGIFERILAKYPDVFQGLHPDKIKFIGTRGKKSKHVIKPHPVKYPFSAFMDGVYVFETNMGMWDTMSDKAKKISVFHVMCMIPLDGCDEDGEGYGKIEKPPIQMFIPEMALFGGVPGWPGAHARDPEDTDQAQISVGISMYDGDTSLAHDGDEDIERTPVTIDEISNV